MIRNAGSEFRVWICEGIGEVLKIGVVRGRTWVKRPIFYQGNCSMSLWPPSSTHAPCVLAEDVEEEINEGAAWRLGYAWLFTGLFTGFLAWLFAGIIGVIRDEIA